jgi:hypothetical protein
VLRVFAKLILVFIEIIFTECATELKLPTPGFGQMWQSYSENLLACGLSGARGTSLQHKIYYRVYQLKPE